MRSLSIAFTRTLVAFAALTLPTSAATINVPKDQPTIQAGIDAAATGDTVLVAPGTYYEHIDFKGKAITVTSSGGATVTTIDGANTGGIATVLFSGGETSSSVISGFTIRGGGDDIYTGTSDGGVFVRGDMGYVPGPSATIQNNIITANYCHDIDVEFASPTIRNNEISGVLQNTQGTGTQESYCGSKDAIYLGGTSNFQNGGSVVIGNTIENNLAGGSAIQVWAAQKVLVMNNVIRNNYSNGAGSAFISVNTGDSAVVQNLIYGNTSTCGGALSFNGGILIANNTIVDNLYVDLSSGSECTPIAQIYPDNYSYGESYPNRIIINNIISGSTSYPAVNCDWFGPPNEADQPTFQSNILYNAGGPFFGSYCVDVSHKYNNITVDPQFVSPSTGDYHLKSSSPAIDSGQNSVLQTFLTMTGKAWSTDFDGNPRVQNVNGQGCVIDMGAYEYPGASSNCAPITETLQSSLNPSFSGQTVTFTAQLSSQNGVPTGTVQFTDGTTILGTETISSTGASTFSTGQLTIGSHAITAIYQPTGNWTTTTTTLTQVVNGYATTASLTSSTNPSTINQPVTFTATVTSASGTPTGTVTFSEGASALTTLPLVNGTATYATSALTAGTHAITATYTPTGSFTGSAATLSQRVNGLPTATVLSAAPLTAYAGLPIALTAVVTSAGSPLTATTGTVVFMDGASTLSTQPVSSTGNATFSTATLSAGIHTITAVFSGDAAHDSSKSTTATVTITINTTALTITSLRNPQIAYQSFFVTNQLISTTASALAPAPTGTVAFFVNGKSTASEPVNSSSISFTLPANTYILTATYSGDAFYAPATSAPITEVITPAPTTTTLTATPNPGIQRGAVTLTAIVDTGLMLQLNGTVTFFDGAASILTVPLNSNNIATFATSGFSPGTHKLTAVYNGATSFITSTSPPLALNIAPQDYTLAAGPTVTIKTEHHANLSVTLTSIGGFSDTVALGCRNLPDYAACTFANGDPALAANATLSTTVEIDTDAVREFKSDARAPASRLRDGFALALLLPLVLLLAARRTNAHRTPRLLVTTLLVLGLAASLSAVTACSSKYPGHTPPGTYTITIAASSGSTTNTAHAVPVTLIVTE